jgi:hypothetical protein
MWDLSLEETGLSILQTQTHFVLCMAARGDVKDPPINLWLARPQHMLMDEALIDLVKDSRLS